ncbi:MAG: transcriptional regulator [Candidatus Cloacimonetes bacterium]|nr:transcriptional regulator [Candidatus Cloacimonadota bacterium]
MCGKEHDLILATREVLAHVKGEIALPSRVVDVPDSVDVSLIRKKLGYTQKGFSEKFGFALSAIKDWEQKRRRPERSARILLALIAANPQAVEQIVKQIG